jgi:hypothetical protein
MRAANANSGGLLFKGNPALAMGAAYLIFHQVFRVSLSVSRSRVKNDFFFLGLIPGSSSQAPLQVGQKIFKLPPLKRSLCTQVGQKQRWHFVQRNAALTVA